MTMSINGYLGVISQARHVTKLILEAALTIHHDAGLCTAEHEVLHQPTVLSYICV